MGDLQGGSQGTEAGRGWGAASQEEGSGRAGSKTGWAAMAPEKWQVWQSADEGSTTPTCRSQVRETTPREADSVAQTRGQQSRAEMGPRAVTLCRRLTTGSTASQPYSQKTALRPHQSYTTATLWGASLHGTARGPRTRPCPQGPPVQSSVTEPSVRMECSSSTLSNMAAASPMWLLSPGSVACQGELLILMYLI